MCDETPVVPAGPLVVPPTTLLLLTSVERTIVVVIAVPKVVLSLLVAETAAGLIPSEITPAVLIVREVSAVILLTRGSVPVRAHGSGLVGPPAVLHTTVVLRVQRLLDWR